MTYDDLTKNQRANMTKQSIVVQNNKDFIVVELNDALTINFANAFDFDSINSTNFNIVFFIVSSSKTKQTFSIVNSNKTKSTFSIIVSKNDDDDEKMSISKFNKIQKKKNIKNANNATKRRKQTNLLIRQSNLMNEKILENEIHIKRFANNTKESKKSKEFDNDEKIDNAQINKKIIFEKSMRTKAIDKNVKIDFNKTLKSKKDENSDELFIDIQLSKFRYHDFLSSEKLKNVEILLSFARKFDNQIFELFQRIEIILTDFDECTMSIAEKIAIDEFIETYRICRNQRTKMKITLINKRSDLIKLIIQHIDSIVRNVDRNFLNVCYVVVREKRFRSNTSIEHDVFKEY